MSTDAPPRLIDHVELHSAANRRRLLAGIEPLLEDTGRPCFSEETKLFKAMHAAAFLVQKYSGVDDRPTVKSRRWEETYRRIFDRLFNANLGLVYEMRRRSRFTNAEHDDLMSEGYWALFQSVRNFDPWKGFRFSTYACNAILRGFLAVVKAETRKKERLADYAERNPPVESDVARQPKGSLATDRLARALDTNLAELTDTERFVLERRYLGTRRARPATLESIGRLIQVSKERVRQIQGSALAKLRAVLDKDPVLNAVGLESVHAESTN
jgi:RNA polymerase sigma factor (sigma-70 family)